MCHFFRDPSLLLHALTHASFAHDEPGAEDNEALEFLGDAIVNFLVTELLFHMFPLEGEGTLSKTRALLVSDDHFARLARRVGLGSALRLPPTEGYAKLRERGSILAGAFEAVFAAVHLDGGLEAARAVTRHLFADDVGALDLGALTRLDPKTALQERAQAEGKLVPVYFLIGDSGPPHGRRFAYEVSCGEGISARGEGNSKKDAQRDAADALLKRLDEEESLRR